MPPSSQRSAHRIGLALLGTVASLLISCSDDRVARDDRALQLLPDSVYAQLPLLLPESSRQLCSPSEPLCTGIRFSTGTWEASGTALVFSMNGGRLQMVRVSEESPGFQQIGRDGSGPGEYRFSMRLGVDSAGTISSLDLRGRRLVQFSAEGEPQRTETLTLPEGLIDAFLLNGRVVYLHSHSRSTGDSAAVSVSTWSPSREARSARAVLSLTRPVTQLGQMMAAPKRFAPQAAFGLRADGKVVFAEGTRLELMVFDTAGARESHLGFAITPRTVTDADRERAAAELGVSVASSGMRSAIRAANQSALEAGPTQHPGVTALVVGADDSIWLREATREQGDSTAWLVFDRSLSPRFRVLLAASDRVLAASLTRVVLTNDDSNADFTDLRILRFPE